MSATKSKVLAFSGGVGGAKLALGLAKVVEPRDLTIAVNTADDFVHLGLSISPDLDTVMYTLAGLANDKLGWGRRDESWGFLQALGELGGPNWFRLGDKDLATNILRTSRLAAGETLSRITADFCKSLGVLAQVIPATDHPLRTRVRSAGKWYDFQRYFVEERCAPEIDEIKFDGAAEAALHPRIAELLGGDTLAAVIICPSNPFVSIEPMLAIPGLRSMLRDTSAPVVAVSPIIGGDAVKGPTAKMMRELGMEVSAKAALGRYSDFLNGYIVDEVDAGTAIGSIKSCVARTLMITLADRIELAQNAITFARSLSEGREK